jgi:hypothetical protein
MVLGAALTRRIFDLTQKLLFAAPFILRRVGSAAAPDVWIIYGVFG